MVADEAELAGDGETWQERLLVRLACRTAVRRGRVLDRPAMRALVEGLGQTDAPAVCPHGSPLLMHVGRRCAGAAIRLVMIVTSDDWLSRAAIRSREGRHACTQEIDLLRCA